jgi:hypothetical protein
MENIQEKIFTVDKKRVIFSILRWQVVMIVCLLLLRDNFNVIKTLKTTQFWWLTGAIVILGLLFDFWEIREGKIKFSGSKIIDYSADKKGIDLNEFSEIKKAKTIYGRCLGLEYKVPKGNKARVLLQYNYFPPETLRGILEEIKKINPQIRIDNSVSELISTK